MNKIFLAAIIAASAPSFAVDCHDIQKVAKEAVATSLLGAWEPFATHACFKNEKYHYFRPEVGTPTGEVTDASKLIWFDQNKDKYTIESVKPKGSKYEIAVKFTIAGKTLDTVYTYDPQPDYAKRNGICGFVVNDTHGIFRRDCLAPGRLPALKK